MGKTKTELIEQLNNTIFENANREIKPTEHNSLLSEIINSMALEDSLTSSNAEFVLKKFIIPSQTNIDEIDTYVNKYFNDYGVATSILNATHYSRCIFTFTQNNEIVYQGNISDSVDFYTKANSNLNFDSNDNLVQKVFIKVSFNINLPEISKFWNYNEGLAILKGYNNLHSKKIVTNPLLSADFVQQLYTWLQSLESGLPNVMKDANSIWFQTTLKSVYNGFDAARNSSQGIMFSNGDFKGRTMIKSDGTSTLVAAVNGTSYNDSIFFNKTSIVVKINTLDYSTLENFEQYPTNQDFCNDNLVRVHLLLFIDPDTYAEYYSILIKPVGIDTIIIGASDIDTTTHKLYGIFYNENTNPIIREITTFAPHSSSSEQSAWGVKKSELIKYMMPRKMQKLNGHVNDSSIKKCKLFYMDQYGNASSFSKAIVIKTRTCGSNFKLVIEK